MFDVDKFYVYPEIANRAEYAKKRFETQECCEREYNAISEVKYACERIKYEDRILEKKGTEVVARKRKIRKEKADLCGYVASISGEFDKDKDKAEEFERCKKSVNDFFELLELF